MRKDTLDKLFQSDDWKNEKHAPLIEAPEQVEKNAYFNVEVSVGKEIGHPNTVEHHIRWIELYFLPEGSKAAQHVATFDFTSHGESGDDDDGVYTHPGAVGCIRIDCSGTLLASAYCNLHGLWQTARAIEANE